MHTLKDLTIEELKGLIGEVVEEKLRELLTDPDAGLALRPEVQERLLKDLQEPRGEGENIPAAQLARRRGRTLTYGDLEHYRKVVTALKETIRLVAETDAAIPKWRIQRGRDFKD